MREFEDRQKSLDQARRQSKQTQRELFTTQEKLAKMLGQRESLQRQAGDAATNARIAELTQSANDLALTIGKLRGQAGEHIRLERGELADFSPSPVQPRISLIWKTGIPFCCSRCAWRLA